MRFKIGRLGYVLVPYLKDVSFFCGVCGGCGLKSSMTTKCSRCGGCGIRTERLRVLRFGGIGRIKDFYGPGPAGYTVVLPQIWDIREDDMARTRDVSMAYWDKAQKTGTTYNTVTAKIPSNHVFDSYSEMLNSLPAEKQSGIRAEILKLGGDPTTYQEDPDKIQTDDEPKSQNKARISISKNDFVTSVVYRSSVHQYFKCKKCNVTNANCLECYGGGKEAIYVPQYIIEGVVKVTRVVNNFVEYLVPPIVFVNNEKHVVSTANYWHEGFGAVNAPKAGQGTMDLLFTTSKAALEWLEKKNRTLLLEWSSLHGRIPLDADGNPMVVTCDTDKVSDKFPKSAEIEPCLL